MSEDRVTTRPRVREHWPEVRCVYAEGLAGGHAISKTAAWDAIAAARQPGIFPGRPVSLRTHEGAGIGRVSIEERLGLMTYGQLAGRWRDVVMVERRSPVVAS